MPNGDRFDSTLGKYIAYGGTLVVDAAIAYGTYRLLQHNDVRLLYTLPMTTATSVIGVVPSVLVSFPLADIVEKLFSRRKNQFIE